MSRVSPILFNTDMVFAAALVRANLPELCVAERMPNMRIDDSGEQLSFAI